MDAADGSRNCLLWKLRLLLEDIDSTQYEDRRLHTLHYVCVKCLNVLISHNNAGV